MRPRLCLFMTLFFVLSASFAQAIELRLVTGPIGGSWYPLGGAIAELVKTRIPGVTISVGPGGGISNVMAIEAGKADLAFGVLASTLDGLAGREPFRRKIQNVRHVATLYRQYFQIVAFADSGIHSVADLRGKTIIPGPRGFTGEQMTRHLLQVYGLSYRDVRKVHHVGYSDAVSLMKDRHADVFLAITTIPAPSILDLASTRKIRLLGLPEGKIRALQRINPGYVRRVIPKGIYPGLEADVVTIGTTTDLLVSANLPEDLVYQITKVVVEGKEELSLVVPDMKGVRPQEMAPDIGVPYHPGALRYYREIKVR